ncbi:hypothetical protein [Glaciihabitans sp. UYNi722]|uniref:hypothetical protein n=1 Tax=Glaciihabitans sp. UYNi722 TaxID=3156344 RepID=UPI0033969384
MRELDPPVVQFMSADYDLSMFLFRCETWRVELDRFALPTAVVMERAYDVESDKLLGIIRSNGTARIVVSRPAKNYTFTERQLQIAEMALKKASAA